MLVALLALACHPADTDVVIDTDPGDTDATDTIEIPDSNLSNVLGDCEGAFREPDTYPNQLTTPRSPSSAAATSSSPR